MNTEDPLTLQLMGLHSEIRAIEECTAERESKYTLAIKCYLQHIKRETKLIQDNIRHSEQRNIMFLQDIAKGDQRAFRNAPSTLKIIKETNREKDGVNLLIGQTLLNLEDNMEDSKEHNQSVDLSKYKDILEEYRHRI